MTRGGDPPRQRMARGRAAEAAAAVYLASRGYELLQRNVRLAGAEVDLVAWHGSCLVFVEVRSRSTLRFGDPVETVGRRKQERIARVAAAWLARQGRADLRVRFDVVGVTWRDGEPVCSLVPDAFQSPW